MIGQFILEVTFFIRLGPLRWVPTVHCAGRRGLNLLTAVRPVELAHCLGYDHITHEIFTHSQLYVCSFSRNVKLNSSISLMKSLGCCTAQKSKIKIKVLYIKPLWCWGQNILGELGQYHGCWCSGSSCHQEPFLQTWFKFNPSMDK